MNDTKNEPTTAEALATVRRERFSPRGRKEADGFETALALLERRMGAMALALHEACPRCCGAMEYWPHCSLCGDSTNDHACPDKRPCDHAVHAATDAPPIFTLEEVRDAVIKAVSLVQGTGLADTISSDTVQYLAALRGTGGGR